MTLGTGVGGGIVIDGKLFEINLRARRPGTGDPFRRGKMHLRPPRLFEAYVGDAHRADQARHAKDRDSALWKPVAESSSG
ncbi:MAG: hypothetical protein ACLS4Z_03845 [Christensenellaceae bacterium]